jgi:phosphinothricin acetyltransferase
MDVTVRAATSGDAESLLAIYRPYVLKTAISFELEPPSLEDFRARIERSSADWACLVAEREGRPLGYAYGSTHRPRAAYQWSVETTVYVAEGSHRRGVGRILYEALLPTLADKGYCNAYAGITLPNENSIGLHRRLGFEPIGVFRSVGRKFGAWHDVSWWHRSLRSVPPHD